MRSIRIALIGAEGLSVDRSEKMATEGTSHNRIPEFKLRINSLLHVESANSSDRSHEASVSDMTYLMYRMNLTIDLIYLTMDKGLMYLSLGTWIERCK